ncbi:hypothetical protein [Kiritimatiella glycovorans]|uniref:Cassette protein A, Verrucomicrobia group n=1 Tax=Kiritimatiella glycovorans TaxID=1307763 RepID=A0A0G3EE56_9BACT|nr:hypothetical protein [Kiritimatiella glycovorans]AKJ64741.1 cassette protein A, Verrucomicrobia group [Kiritimatiella glycovorans]
MRTSQAYGNREPRAGIALIAVIGVLSVLMLLAVSFAAYIRTERLISHGHINDGKAVQLMDAAIARTADYLYEYMNEEVDGKKRLCTERDGDRPVVLRSGTGVDVHMYGSSIHATAHRYVPLNFTDHPDDGAGWEPIRYGGRLIGRYAFLAYDCSGKIDISHAGGYDPASGMRARSNAASAAELQLSASVIADIDDAEAYLSDRRQYLRRFESPLETIIPTGTVSRAGDELNCRRGRARDLYHFSFYPAWRPGSDSPRFDLGKPLEASGADAVAAIFQHLEDEDLLDFGGCTFGGEERAFTARDMARNLRDYVDADRIPGDLASFCTESVPMAGELMVSNSVEKAGNTFRLYLEMAYPFPTNRNDQSFAVEVEGLRVTCGGQVQEYDWDFSYTPDTESVHVEEKSVTHPSTNFPARVDLDRIVTRMGGDMVDVVSNLTGRISMEQGEAKTVAVRDPRINFAGTDTNQWESVSTNSIGRPNHDDVDFMYVADRPLRNVAELGYLSHGIPRRTIRLYGPQLCPVTDYFVASSRPPEQGLIPINTENRNALITAFLGAPVYGQIYHAFGDDWKNRREHKVSESEAAQLADFFTNLTRTAAFTNSLDWARNEGFFNEIGYEFETEEAREAFVGMIQTLIGTRNAVYTCLIKVQAIDDLDRSGSYTEGGDTILGEKNVAAVIWLDPRQTDRRDQPRLFVQMIDWRVGQ